MASQIPYLDVQNLTKRFGAQVLFDNISFSIAEGQKVGLVARNGTGKSTLMSVLMDKEGHESGDIIYRRDLKVGYLEQSPQFDPEESVLQACFNHEDDPEKVLKAKQILTQLHITNLEQPMGQLSGGQQKRVALANVLITEPDFLMLDEPTNHLDLEMIEWLEGYLNRGNKTIFMVTHDRNLLWNFLHSTTDSSSTGLRPPLQQPAGSPITSQQNPNQQIALHPAQIHAIRGTALHPPSQRIASAIATRCTSPRSALPFPKW